MIVILIGLLLIKVIMTVSRKIMNRSRLPVRFLLLQFGNRAGFFELRKRRVRVRLGNGFFLLLIKVIMTVSRKIMNRSRLRGLAGNFLLAILKSLLVFVYRRGFRQPSSLPQVRDR